MHDTAAFWDRIAEKYARSPIKNIASYEYTREKTRAFLQAEHDVLELGCGTGSTALELAPSVRTIIATDISAAMIAKAQEKLQADATTNVTFARADASDAPLGPFDAVLAFNLLHLVEDLDASLAEIHRRTKPGGLFVSKTFCVPDGLDLKIRVMRLALPLLQWLGRAPHVLMFGKAELEAALIRAGFDIVEGEQPPGADPRYYIVARRAG